MNTAFRYPRPALLAEMMAPRHYAVEASAGTGKTYLIERRIADLLMSGAATIDEILVVTFTEKATAELRRRVHEFVRELLAVREHAAAPEEPHWLIDDAARRLLSAALESRDRASISTIHGFCNRLLKSTSFVGGRMFDQTQVTDEWAFADAFAGALRERFAVDPGDAQYLSAWLDGGGTIPALRKLLYKCSQLRGDIAPRVDEAELGAALVEVGRALRGPGAALATAGLPGNKQKAVAARLPKLGAAVVHFENNRSIAAALGELDRKELEYLGENLAAGELAAAVGRLARAHVPLRAAVAQRFLPALEQRLDENKISRGHFDYLDMLKQTWQTLSGPAGDDVTARVRARYRYALIDEFQDTDLLQWQIFRRLFLTEPEAGESHCLTVVGDPKQAIYSFRGADLPVYHAALAEIRARGGALLRLDTNYRSTPALVGALNQLFAAEDGRGFFAGGVEFVPVRAGRPDDGCAGPPIIHMRLSEPASVAQVRRAYAQAIARECDRLIGAGAAPEQIFVLTRATREAEEVALALREQGVPCALYQQEGLLQTEQASDVRDLLCAIAEPNDRARRLRAWQTGFFGLALGDLLRAAEAGDGHPLVARLFEWHRLAARREYEQLFGRIARDCQLAQRMLFLYRSERALENYQHLFELLLAEVLESRGELHELIERMQTWMEDTEGWDGAGRNLQRLETDSGAVQVMTIHKSKGLEADVVFLFGGFARGGGGETPVRVSHRGDERVLYVGSGGGGDGDDEAAENQRLMYVAATRARTRLYVPEIPADVLEVRGAYGPLHERVAGAASSASEVLDVPLVSAAAAPIDMARLGGVVGGFRPDLPAPAAPLLFAPARSGIRITSYSRLRGREPDSTPFAAERPASDGLPGGRETGIFLHAVLEQLPLATVRGSAQFDEWRARSEIADLFEREMRAHELDLAHLTEYQRCVYRALTAPVALGTTTLPSLADVTRERREVEFLYPVAGSTAVKGFFDFLFEWDGKVYVLDWKSDLLEDYGPAAVDSHVTAHYLLQARLYSIGMLRAVGPERFGGLVLLFLRGPASWFLRPDRGELEAALATLFPSEERP